jgi:hypothetical protein
LHNNVPADKQADTTESFQTTSTVIDSDSLMLRKLILASDRILGIPKIKSTDKERAEKFNKEMQNTAYRTSIYNMYEFKPRLMSTCNGYRHMLLSKKSRNDNQPFTGLYLLIMDSSNRLVATERLEEESRFGHVNTANWTLKPDSILTIDSKSHFCSDEEIEYEGKAYTECWTETIHKVYQLKCNGLVLIKRDSVRLSNIE